MEKLRDEILQSERIRADLLKWKLVLVGVLGAVGLGLSGTSTLRRVDLVLCVIPPVCVYVDLLCRHLTLKMLVIGAFLRGLKPSDPTSEVIANYESHVERAWKVGAFDLENWALAGSTVALSIALVVYGIVLWSWFSFLFILSGMVGIVATFFSTRLYTGRFHHVRDNAVADPGPGPASTDSPSDVG